MPRSPRVRKKRSVCASATRARVRRLAVNAADHLIGKQRFDAAASILENYRNAHPEDENNADVLRRLGRVRLAQGKPQEAAKLFEKALSSLRDSLPAVPAPRELVATD